MDLDIPRTPLCMHPSGCMQYADNQPIRDEQSDSETSTCPKRRRRARRRGLAQDKKVVRCLFPDLTTTSPFPENDGKH